MAARKRKVELSDSWKDGIRASNIMRRLYDHCSGEIDMSQSQIKAAQIVLSKIVPDLARQELVGENGGDIKFTVNAPWLEQAIQKRNSG